MLFNDLPEQCVVILEDIDSAGIKNRGNAAKGTDKKPKPTSYYYGIPQDEGISLSGLLNVIDGIGSKEGRILIMTTNTITTLDPALIRPGRIDITVKFSLLFRKGTEQLFTLMYRKVDAEETTKTSTNTEKPRAITSKLKDENDEAAVLKTAATRFTNHIMENTFSAAEVQGYLLTMKSSIEGAISGIAEWVAETLEKKRNNEKKRTKFWEEGSAVEKEKEEEGEEKEEKAKGAEDSMEVCKQYY